MPKVKVYYSGKRCPWTVSMPWLSEPVTFDESREAVMVQPDAERLCAKNPTDFHMGKVIPDSGAQPKKKTPAKKKPVSKE